jgi:hypothetical protein
MSSEDGVAQFVRATLDEIGVTLQSDAEYEDVALRLAVVVEGVRALIAEFPYEFGALLPGDIPWPWVLPR